MDLQEEVILNYDINGYENKPDLFSKNEYSYLIVLKVLQGYSSN